MAPKTPPTPTDFHADDAPDLSSAEWRERFSKALPASGPLESVELERVQDVVLADEGAPLKTEDDYQAALREIERYFGQEPDFGTPEAKRFDQLAEQIRLYEGTHWPISPTDADR